MKQRERESYHGLELPAPLGNMVTMATPPSCPKIMPKHDEDRGDIGEKILADSWG